MTFEWQSQILRQQWGASSCHPFSHFSRLICSMLLHPRVVPLCVHTHVYTDHGTHQEETVLTCAHTIYVFRAAARNFCISASAFWWVADVSLSFYVGSELQAWDPAPWGALSWDWTQAIGCHCRSIVCCRKRAVTLGKLISKESCFSAQVEGCWFVWDVLHFETHTSPSLCLFKSSCFVGCFHHGKLGILILFLKIVCCVWISPGSTPEEDFMSRKVPRLKETKRQLHSVLETHLMRSEALARRTASLLAHPKCALHLQLPGGPVLAAWRWEDDGEEAVVRGAGASFPAGVPAAWSCARLHHNSYCVSLINALLKLWNYKRKKRMHLFRLLIH